MDHRSQMASFYKRYEGLYLSKIQDLLLSEIANGTINPKRINAYIVQDIYYMEALVLRLKQLAELVGSEGHSKAILERDANLTVRMVADWRSFLSENSVGKISDAITNRTAEYIEHQRRSVQRGLQTGLAATLPCYLYCYKFVVVVRNAIATASTVDSKTRKYLDNFAERLPSYKMPSLDYEILQIWEEAIGNESRTVEWSDLMAVFRESSIHEWRIFE